jgi:hypothetical protein
MLRLAVPGIQQLTWRLAIPLLASRGLRNLVALAEERAVPTEASRPSSTAAGSSLQTKEM